MSDDTQAQLDALESEIDATMAELQNDARPKAMMAGVALAFKLMWKALRLVHADVQERKALSPPES